VDIYPIALIAIELTIGCKIPQRFFTSSNHTYELVKSESLREILDILFDDDTTVKEVLQHSLIKKASRHLNVKENCWHSSPLIPNHFVTTIRDITSYYENKIKKLEGRLNLKRKLEESSSDEV
jgi:hypothetical protein